ncbi:monofunctional biosynthetic peptidoglycan transglycosylase [Tropicimonas sp. IMCC34043]|uniref:monofunctional biosynthetic peptidoglycan transglycosylase n=1 Tax=Tropicimonas sp. IMCC34043 TaxID=2248760 RepID=UPI0035161476
MARATKTQKKQAKAATPVVAVRARSLWRRGRKWALRLALAPVVLLLLLIVAYRWVNPPITHTIWADGRRLGGVEQQWVPFEQMGRDVPLAFVAAEDANFCLHWGFDMGAIRTALDDGARRGASTITQQTVKNVFLWQGRSWIRKALETVITPVVELVWPKRRILEIYLNVAEMDRAVFGIEAAAQTYFGVPPAELTLVEAARIAAVLPDPKGRDAARPTAWLRKRTAAIADGARTIAADGRNACFKD